MELLKGLIYYTLVAVRVLYFLIKEFKINTRQDCSIVELALPQLLKTHDLIKYFNSNWFTNGLEEINTMNARQILPFDIGNSEFSCTQEGGNGWGGRRIPAKNR